MKCVRLSMAASAFVGTLGLSAVVSATTEPPSVHDARSVAMGSTAVAHTHNGAALFHNIAALHEVEKLTATLNVVPTKINQTSPLNGPGSAVDSDSPMLPLFLLGGAYRVHERVVIGLAGYGTGGFGAEYDVPIGPYKVSIGALELSPGAAIALTDNLSVGVGWRVSYVMQQGGVRLPNPIDPSQPPVDSSLDLDGLNFTGAHVSLYYRPIESLKLGLAYRSKVVTELDGTMKSGGQELDATSEFAFPHALRAGAAFEAIKDKLVLALDVRYLLHSEANDEIVIDVPPVMTTKQKLDWSDSVNIGVGAEFKVTEVVPVRAGYALTTSATAEDRPSPFFVPPGVLHSVHAGAGLNFEKVALDLGGYYTFGGSDVDSVAADDPTLIPGRYDFTQYCIAASVTYHTD